MRTLRKINEYATGTYISILGTSVFGVTIIFSEKGFTFHKLFTITDYLVLLVMAILGAMTMMTKAKSMQYEMVSRTSILCYLSIIVMFFFDLFLYNTAFHMSDVNGILIITLANIIAAFFIFFKNKP